MILAAQEKADSATMLHEVVVQTRSREAVSLGRLGQVRMNLDKYLSSYRSFGESDPMAYLQLLPGVAAWSDYSSGLSVQGAAFSQTEYRIDSNAPVFFPYRFGGLFSAFNGWHLNDLTLTKGARNASKPNRIGGIVDLAHRHADYSVQANVGMTASSAAIDLPLSSKLRISAAARISYLNLLYSEMLKGRTTATKYSFADLNAAIDYKPTQASRLKISAFSSRDNLGISDSNFGMHSAMRWRNNAYSAVYSLDFSSFTLAEKAYYSSYSNRLSLNMPGIKAAIPSSISQAGNTGTLTYHGFGASLLELAKTGYALEQSWLKPQSITSSGFGYDRNNRASTRSATEGRIFAEADLRLSAPLLLSLAAKFSTYVYGGHAMCLFDPNATLIFEKGSHTIEFSLGSASQTLHQVGFSDLGLASNFWISTSKTRPATRAFSASIAYSRSLLGGALRLNAEAYGKRVLRDYEYRGMLLDLLNADYNADNYIISGNGYNYGIDISLAKNSGKVTGILSYAYGAARRKFPALSSRYTNSATALGHAANLYASYSPNEHWQVGGKFAVHSGRPITPVKAIYVIAENLVTEYGLRNSSRLPLYHRLDLFATYKFTSGNKKRLHHSINLSILNAYAHANVEMVSFSFSTETGKYHTKEVSSLYKMLPSISYSIQF